MSNNTDLKGRVALVTGAGVGIGSAIALALADSGAGVGVHCWQSVAEAEETVSSITSRGGRAWRLAADLADPKRAGKLVGELIDRGVEGVHVDVQDHQDLSEECICFTGDKAVNGPVGVTPITSGAILSAPFRARENDGNQGRSPSMEVSR